MEPSEEQVQENSGVSGLGEIRYIGGKVLAHAIDI